MSRGGVERLLTVIDTCQNIGCVWMAQIVFAFLLDRLLMAGLPKRVWIDFIDHLEEGGLVVVVTKNMLPKSISGRLFSADFRSYIINRRHWGRGLLPIRPHERISRSARETSACAFSSSTANMSQVLKDLSDNNIEEILQRARGYFESHTEGFEQALSMFQAESDRRKTSHGKKR